MTAKLYDLDEDAESAPRFVVDAYDHNLVVARLAEAVTLLEAIDNADAITIDRDFPAADVAIAEALWGSIHRITTEYAERAAVSAVQEDVTP